MAQVNGEADGLAEFSETWPSWGYMRNGQAYQLPPLAAPTSENAFGLWPTPTASDRRDCGETADSTERQIRNTTDPKFKSAKRITMVWAARMGTSMPTEFPEWIMGFPHNWTDI
jgi:hypothetical protein